MRHQMPTPAHLKRVAGRQATRLGHAHVVALPAGDVAVLRFNLDATEETHGYKVDMRSWRPRDGFAIISTDHRFLPLADNWEIVHRAEAR